LVLRHIPVPSWSLGADGLAGFMESVASRDLVFILAVPWDQAEPNDRFRALELASAIIFPDTSLVAWTGTGWRCEYRLMPDLQKTPHADAFMFDLGCAIFDAQWIWENAAGRLKSVLD
jgi:hypothetical protein